ncbi:MAG: sugar phosphate isomerase/epimerase [Chloroflexi bacterium CFX4]|nr:sugar phosphate isomerase/epimerase [Chloroflexi bacterium CFX4]MDL1923593.1 sugar phosphate isomerase/epimerase [Chloroflexi bacterium CFX3]
MARPVTLFTGQWADLPLSVLAEKVASWGYDGLELACWGDHFDVSRALSEDGYIQSRHDILAKHGLKCFAISTHLVGQCVCDLIDERHKSILPPHVWGDGEPEGVRQRAAQEVMNTARAAAKMGVKVVNGFTGSSVWHLIYRFPPTSDEMVEAGYTDFAARWNPILDVFDEVGVRFGLEVHPTEIAYDIVTTHKALDAIKRRPAFGINFDPSHLNHQFVDSVAFIEEFADRIYHVHVKDSLKRLDGRRSILASHLGFGDRRRGWDFVSPGRGEIDFEQIVRSLNAIGYDGPLSVEWEDSGMNREVGAAEAVQVVRRADISPSNVAFDAAFQKD